MYVFANVYVRVRAHCGLSLSLSLCVCGCGGCDSRNEQVAARFATNWLQIWHFNPTIMHPDSALPPETLINIGHLYEVWIQGLGVGFGVRR